jgi:hypothetical protein
VKKTNHDKTISRPTRWLTAIYLFFITPGFKSKLAAKSDPKIGAHRQHFSFG